MVQTLKNCRPFRNDHRNLTIFNIILPMNQHKISIEKCRLHTVTDNSHCRITLDGGSVRPEILLQKNNGGEVFGIEGVRGKRLCIASETDEDAALSVSMMKRLTSRDTISANPKHKQPFEFTPSHTLILHTNHLPSFRQFDEGTKRRMAVAKFPHTPNPSEIIVDLMDQLTEEEGEGILQWMIDGSIKYYKNGCQLSVPESVKNETTEYISSNDWMTQFLEDCCEIGDGRKCVSNALYQKYTSWCKENGEPYCKHSKVFASELTSRGFTSHKTKKCNEWIGFEIASEFLQP